MSGLTGEIASALVALQAPFGSQSREPFVRLLADHVSNLSMVTSGKTALALPLYGQAYPIKELSQIEID